MLLEGSSFWWWPEHWTPSCFWWFSWVFHPFIICRWHFLEGTNLTCATNRSEVIPITEMVLLHPSGIPSTKSIKTACSETASVPALTVVAMVENRWSQWALICCGLRRSTPSGNFIWCFSPWHCSPSVTIRDPFLGVGERFPPSQWRKTKLSCAWRVKYVSPHSRQLSESKWSHIIQTKVVTRTPFGHDMKLISVFELMWLQVGLAHLATSRLTRGFRRRRQSLS